MAVYITSRAHVIESMSTVAYYFIHLGWLQAFCPIQESVGQAQTIVITLNFLCFVYRCPGCTLDRTIVEFLFSGHRQNAFRFAS